MPSRIEMMDGLILEDGLKYRVRSSKLPLAVYREVAAHLSQVNGVETSLVPQQSQQFDYTLSQIDSLWIQYPGDTNSRCHKQVQQILAYYSDRYGAWETVEAPVIQSNSD